MAKLFLLVRVCVATFAVTIALASDISSLELSNATFAQRSQDAAENYLYYFDTTIQLVSYHGYGTETHIVETNDGYILELHRITGNKANADAKGKPAVLLQHGLLCSSIDWVITGPNKGLGFILADVGYDVWIGNVRGNVYSRKHRYLSVDDPQFWKFSWHEIGIHDIPAMIDHILNETGHKKLFYIGHSQGTTAFYVMASELPAYNDKIHAMFSLAPVAYSSNMHSPILRFLSKMIDQLEDLAELIGFYEVKPTSKFFTKFTSLICRETAITQKLCENIVFMLEGFDSAQLDDALLPTILKHLPAGASVQQIIHYGQIIKSGGFHKFDYGRIANLREYGRSHPPSYKLRRITAPVALHYSSNDWLSNAKDVDKLYSKLPNAIGKFYVNYEKFNHMDYLYAINVQDLLYNQILWLMRQYGGLMSLPVSQK